MTEGKAELVCANSVPRWLQLNQAEARNSHMGVRAPSISRKPDTEWNSKDSDLYSSMGYAQPKPWPTTMILNKREKKEN